MSTAIALDVGGTNLRAASVDAHGRIPGRIHRKPWHASRWSGDADTLNARLEDELVELILRTRDAGGGAVVGIGFPGFVRRDGTVIASPNLPWISALELGPRLERRLGMPVFIENDANCAALAEYRLGAGRGAESLLHLTLGTGIGAGFVAEGRLWRGDGGMAMELGHLRATGGEKALPCGCGQRGCLETVASATGVANAYRARTGRDLEAVEIARRAEASDPDARAVIKDAASHLGKALAEAVKLLDTRRISLGGGLAESWSLIAEPAAEALDSSLPAALRGRIELVRARLGDEAGLIGAGLCALSVSSGSA